MGTIPTPINARRSCPVRGLVGSSSGTPRLLRCDYCGTETDIEWMGVRIEEVRCRACHERQDKR